MINIACWKRAPTSATPNELPEDGDARNNYRSNSILN